MQEGKTGSVCNGQDEWEGVGTVRGGVDFGQQKKKEKERSWRLRSQHTKTSTDISKKKKLYVNFPCIFHRNTTTLRRIQQFLGHKCKNFLIIFQSPNLMTYLIFYPVNSILLRNKMSFKIYQNMPVIRRRWSLRLSPSASNRELARQSAKLLPAQTFPHSAG